ncbi:MAG: hypothetical protein EOP87_12325, partial [Verrucomicrobiaceae bacterium]
MSPEGCRQKGKPLKLFKIPCRIRVPEVADLDRGNRAAGARDSFQDLSRCLSYPARERILTPVDTPLYSGWHLWHDGRGACRRSMSVPRKPLAIAALATALLGAAFFSSRHSNTPAPKPEAAAPMDPNAPVLAPDDKVHAGYAGSESCRKCHAAQFESWQHSNHGLAEREVDMSHDKNAFSPKQTLVHGKDTTELFLDADGLAKVLTQGLDKKRHVYPLVRVIGNNPLRQFLIPAPGGRMQTLDVSLDPLKNEWFDVYGNEDARGPGDWGHWTGQGMNWNAMCAACHNTRVRKNYEPRTNSYHTSMAEMSIGCESCHGPMKAHVEWQEKPPLDKAKDPTIPHFTRDQVMETCAACHSRRSELTGDLVPGDSFHDHFSLTVT